MVRVLQLDQHAVCVVSGKLGANGCRAFFLLLAARVRSSCEEGPGQSALQSA